MKTNHTPGIEATPGSWKVENHWITDQTGLVTIASLPTVLPGFKGHPGIENEANARLIATAPELLQALETLIQRREKSGMPLNVDCWQQARTAIEKARGETKP